MVALQHALHLARDLHVGHRLLVVDDLQDVVHQLVEEVAGDQPRFLHEVGLGGVLDRCALAQKRQAVLELVWPVLDELLEVVQRGVFATVDDPDTRCL